MKKTEGYISSQLSRGHATKGYGASATMTGNLSRERRDCEMLHSLQYTYSV